MSLAIKAFIRRANPDARHKLRRWIFPLARAIETVVWGGEFKERILVKLLSAYYASQFRREWIYRAPPPHFFDQRLTYFAFGYGKQVSGPYGLSRGFFVADLLRDGDCLLDIGCGDGFFTKRFFAARCAHIDAIDSDPEAMRAATMRNSAPNITYALLDAAAQPFPCVRYDVIVWDGAIGHFVADDCQRVLEKIVKALAPEGVFVGSESLGREGSDHLQFFASLDDLFALFKPYFKYVELRKQTYSGGSLVRQEAYWRCANDPTRLRECDWKTL